MRTKEEILDRYAAKTNWEFDKHDPGYEVALGAMEVYAKEVAVKFLNWAEEKYSGYEGLSFNRFYDEKKEPTLFIKHEETTLSELYNQFIQSLNKEG